MAKYYIDREALIEWLKRIPLIDLSDGRGLCRVIMEDDFKKAIKEMPKDIVADVEPVQEWIPVDDRLPENGVHVLLCCEIHRYDGEIDGKYVCDGYYAEANKLIAREDEYNEEDDEYYLREGWYEVIKNWDAYTSVPVEDFVTHWMPLPEPQKGK